MKTALLFQGRSDGVLAAYRATDGRQLWQFDAGTGIIAPPVTYLVNGIQHVSVMAGWDGAHGAMNAANRGTVKPSYAQVLTFVLGRTATLAVRAFGHAGPPTPAITMDASPETVHEGKLLYGRNCSGCHGLDAVAGTVPDLRYATKAVHDQFEAIVLEGIARHSACRRSRIFYVPIRRTRSRPTFSRAPKTVRLRRRNRQA